MPDNFDIQIVDDAFRGCNELGDIICIHMEENTAHIRGNVKGISFSEILHSPTKNHIKRLVYLNMSRITGVRAPYGILVGIRPVKIVHELLDRGFTAEKSIDILIEEYLMESDKAKLLVEIARGERERIFPIDGKAVSIYIAIPFCKSRCYYCSFPGMLIDKNKKLAEGYVKALKIEIVSLLGYLKSRSIKIDNLYLGGGTPSALEALQLQDIISTCNKYIDFNKLEEFTIEAGRPDTVNDEMLKVIESSGCNRICINPQSMNDNTLRRIGRTHTSNQIEELYGKIDRRKIKYVNMDLIAGLEGESFEEFADSLKKVAELSPENITIHSLSVKRGSKLGENKNNYNMTDIDSMTHMLEFAEKHLRSHDYVPYYLYRQKNIMGNMENIGYSKAGLQCIYNMKIMTERNTFLGMGAGSSSKFYRGEGGFAVFNNAKGVHDYIDRIDEMIEKKIQRLNEIYSI